MRRFPLFICILMLVFASGFAVAEGNLIKNGGFEEAADGWPVNWVRDMWLYDEGTTYLSLTDGGRDGGQCAMIENVAENDARFLQNVAVEPETLYRLSGFVKAEGCGPDGSGANLSVLGVFEPFSTLHDTGGEWVEMVVYIETDRNQTSVPIAARLGGYSADNTGKAWFDDLSLEKIDALPPGAKQVMLVNPRQQSAAATTVQKPAIVAPSLFWVALFLLIPIGFQVLRAHGISMPKAAIFVLLAGAAALRLYLMMTHAGYVNDLNTFLEWSLRMAKYGPNRFYDPVIFCDYPPGYMYVLWVTGGLLRLFNISSLRLPETEVLARTIIKLMPVLADMATIALIWRFAKKRVGNTPALLLAALYAFSPAVLIDGAIWGQADAVVALGLLITVALVAERNWMAALPVFTLTVLMKPQALIAGPIGLSALALDIWKCGGSKVKADGKAAKALIPGAQKKLLLEAAKGLGLSVLLAAVLLLPFLWGKEQPLSWVLSLYTGAMGGYPNATINAANLYYLLGANWTPLANMLGPLSYGTWGTVFMVASIASLIALYWKHGDRENLPLYCALAYILLYLFGVMMHERYLYPALALLVFAFIRKRDWRLPVLFGGFSITFYLNCMWVLRDNHLPLGIGLAGGILSAVNLALGGLALWVAIDNKAKPFPKKILALLQSKPDDAPAQSAQERRLASLSAGRTPGIFSRMRRRDYLVMAGLTLVYSVIAYTGLGDTTAPQSVWMSTGAAEEVIFDLGESAEFEILFYPGINSRTHVFTLEFSEDGDTWYGLSHGQILIGQCFSWRYLTQAVYDDDGTPTNWTDTHVIARGRYVRMLTSRPSMTLMEMVFRDMEGSALPITAVSSDGYREENKYDPRLLVDESDTVPENPTYMNSTYFDEIYHARTGYEHANKLSTYEYTHPPLGKVMIMLAIKIFGMTPFGWRFMGTLMGVLMVPAMYLLGKLLFKRTRFATLSAFVMAFDMMHLTQTRIATIDSYAVLYIILMYLCMFRYLQMSFFRDGWRTLLPLGLSGLFFGLGSASKWICLYAGVGLAVLFAWSMVQRYQEWKAIRDSGDVVLSQKAKQYVRYLLGTLGFCVMAFILVPFAIYYFSYIPQFAWEGGLTWKRFWDTQAAIFKYHSTLVDTHDFASPWYEWPLMLKPMYYYKGNRYAGAGNVSTIMCMGNPAVWWIGFCALLYTFWQWFWPHLTGRRVKDHRPAMILLAFAAQFLPWVLVPRSMFIYHYFGSLPFVMLCIVYVFERIDSRKPALARKLQIGFMAVVLLLFVAYYPFATGVPFPETWAKMMNWLSFLKLPGAKFRGWLYF